MSKQIAGRFNGTMEDGGIVTGRFVPDGIPPIPELALWESNMLKWGVKYAEPLGYDDFFERGVVYFDGALVYRQIADYYKANVGEVVPQWVWDGIAQCERIYLGYCRAQYDKRWGAIPGYRVFPHGIEAAYKATSNAKYETDLLFLANTGWGAHSAEVIRTWIYCRSSREVAYLLQALLACKRAGISDGVRDSNKRIAALSDVCAAHMRRWFVENAAPWLQPFMVGLTAHALIEYVAEFPLHKARIVDILTRAADWLWEYAWVDDDQSFYYKRYDPYEGDTVLPGAPDLNLLIAPMYAWLWKQKGEVRFLERGDAIFAGGVKNAWLAGGKQFSQSYRWSFKYIEWRQGK